MRRSPRPGLIEIRVPLKLVLAGEYAVLEDKGTAIACAVDRHVICRVATLPSGVTLTGDEPGLTPLELAGPLPDGRLVRARVADEAAARYRFALGAADLAYGYVADLGLLPRPAHIDICSAAGRHVLACGTEVKLGLGTSASSTVAVVAAILAHHGVPIDRPTFRSAVLKLALFAHTRAQGDRGSGIDVATAVTGGVIAYTRASTRWLRQLMESGKGPLEVARAGWPGLKLEGIPPPRGMRLLVGFTGQSSSTMDRVAAYERWRRRNKTAHRQFIQLTRRAVVLLRASLEQCDVQSVNRAISWARGALGHLEKGAGFEIETDKLQLLARAAFRVGAAGKLSGAGGGDCGIALAFSDHAAAEVEAAWREVGIEPVPVAIEPWGIRERRIDREVAHVA